MWISFYWFVWWYAFSLFLSRVTYFCFYGQNKLKYTSSMYNVPDCTKNAVADWQVQLLFFCFRWTIVQRTWHSIYRKWNKRQHELHMATMGHFQNNRTFFKQVINTLALCVQFTSKDIVLDVEGVQQSMIDGLRPQKVNSVF